MTHTGRFSAAHPNMANMANMRVHFRYHDGVDALIGIERYRYEIHRYKDISELAKSLVKVGMDGFSWRQLNSLDTWHDLTVVYG